MIELCEWPEIAKNLDRVFLESELKDKEIALRVGCHGSAVARARDGTQEPGIERFVRLCVAGGTTPDQVVFRAKLPQNLPILVLDEEDKQELVRLAQCFIKMNHLAPEALKMARVFRASAEAAVREAEAFVEAKKAKALPMGSNIQHIAPGETKFDSPPKAERSRKGDTGKNQRFAAGEDEQKYGKKNTK